MATDLEAETTPDAVSVRHGGDLLVRTRRAGAAGAHCQHVDTLAVPGTAARWAGRNLVDSAPHDHPWHRGLYFCQKLVDGVNCWAPSEHPDPESRATATPVDRSVSAASDAVSVASTARWETGGGDPLLDDERTVTVYEPEGGSYLLDWRQRVVARGGVRRLSSETLHGHYSGLSLRFARSMAGGGVRLPDHEDPDDGSPPREASGPAGAYCDYTGLLDGPVDVGGVGEAAREARSAGVALFDHPGNGGVRWFTMNDPFGFVSANPTWGTVLALEEDEAASWRWGVWVHAGRPDREELAAARERYLSLVG
jgi:hypothetical protein